MHEKKKGGTPLTSSSDTMLIKTNKNKRRLGGAEWGTKAGICVGWSIEGGESYPEASFTIYAIKMNSVRVCVGIFFDAKTFSQIK